MITKYIVWQRSPVNKMCFWHEELSVCESYVKDQKKKYPNSVFEIQAKIYK